MDDLRSLCKDAKEFSQEVKRFEDYLENDVEPPDCDETIKKFRLNAGETLSSLTARCSDIQAQISAASTFMDSSRNLLENLEQVVQKREVQLCKYGFKPTKRDLPPFPELQISREKSRESDGNKIDLILQKVSEISGSSSREKALLIAKYTPAKKKRLNTILPSENQSDPSALVSKYNGDPGDKTYVISENTHDGNAGLSQPGTKTVGKNIGLEDRVARYSMPRKQTEVESEETSCDKSSDIRKRMERYSTLPQNDPPFSITSKSSEVEPIRNIDDLLSKYAMHRENASMIHRENASMVQGHLPVVVKKESHPKIVTPKSVTQKVRVNAQNDSFSADFVSNPFRPSIVPPDVLERTVNIPTYFRNNELVGLSNVISTPKKLQSVIVEIKTPNCRESTKPTTDYDNLGGVSAEQFTKSESNIVQTSVTSGADEQDVLNVANNENVENVNSSATINIPVTRHLSSIFAKYSHKYNNS